MNQIPMFEFPIATINNNNSNNNNNNNIME